MPGLLTRVCQQSAAPDAVFARWTGLLRDLWPLSKPGPHGWMISGDGRSPHFLPDQFDAAPRSIGPGSVQQQAVSQALSGPSGGVLPAVREDTHGRSF